MSGCLQFAIITSDKQKNTRRQPMSTERDLFLANAELERRRREAAEARKARQSREQEPQEQHDEQPEANGFAWLRRLVGVSR
jgi:hypothetical protein